jgi:CRP-like cAMP-binding protein
MKAVAQGARCTIDPKWRSRAAPLVHLRTLGELRCEGPVFPRRIIARRKGTAPNVSISEQSELLDALQPQDHALLSSRLTEVRLETGRILYDPGEPVDYCYFPRGGSIASFFVVLGDGEVVETLMVGREGALGAVVSNGATPAYARLSVMHGGAFYRIPAAELDHVKDSSPAIRLLFARYADCLMAQVFQSIACNAIHTIEQRAAKWLIAATERIGRNDITMTQEQLASMMGIGRSYASRVVQRFKSDGLVRTRRGGIEVVAPEQLEQRACTCNHLVKRHFETVLAGVYPAL